MRILLFTRKFPFPINDGASIAINTLAKALVGQGATLDLFSLNTSKDYYEYNEVPNEIHYYRSVYSVDINTNISFFGACYNLFSGAPYHVSRFHSTTVSQQLVSVLKDNTYDIIQLEGTHLLAYLPAITSRSQASIVLRAHNIEHRIWIRQAKIENSILKRWYLRLQASRFKHYEEQKCALVDGILSVSTVDLQFFKRQNNNVISIPIGTNLMAQTESTLYDKLRVGFIGSMDWMPNQIGLKWFLEKVWVSDENPSYELILAGKKFDQFSYVFPESSNIKLLGEVENAELFWDSIDMLIVPLFSGSGTRVKILEGLARGKIVLSTVVGAEGIGIKSGINGFLTDDITEWKRILRSFDMKSLESKLLLKEAKQLIRKEYSSKEVAAKAMSFYKQLLRR